MLAETLPWVIFLAFIAAMLALDLGVFNRHAHAIQRKEALAWSIAWIGLAIAFNAGVYAVMGPEAGLEWTTGYLIEKSLSVDNIFVILLIFSAFAVPAAYQHRVLFWGIVGAVAMRGALIGLAGFLFSSLHAVIYVFGAFLIFTGIKFLRDQEETPDPRHSRVLRAARRLVPSTDTYEGDRFFVRRGRILMTPLFLVLLLIESTDLMFAVDSIPAIYAVTDRPFIVFTSNIFALLGLRSLYFVFSGYLAELPYLKPALAAILVFVGAKMLAADLYHVPTLLSLTVIAAILGLAIGASLLVRKPGYQSGVAPEPAAE